VGKNGHISPPLVPNHALYQAKLRPEFVLMHITRSNPVHPES